MDNQGNPKKKRSCRVRSLLENSKSAQSTNHS